MNCQKSCFTLSFFNASYFAPLGLLACLAFASSAEAFDDSSASINSSKSDFSVIENEGSPVPENGTDSFSPSDSEKISVKSPVQKLSKKRIPSEFSKEVFAEICRLGIRAPQIVMRQAMLETGWLKAPFLMKRNNLFGFRTQKYLSFSHWKESVNYYKNWQSRHYKDSDTNYYDFLVRRRYGESGYIKNLRRVRWDEECPPALGSIFSNQSIMSLSYSSLLL